MLYYDNIKVKMGLGCVRPIDPLSAVIPRTISIDVSAIKNSRIPIIFLIGGPGAGKSLLSLYLYLMQIL